MRYFVGFGLVGLLVVCGIYAMFFNKIEYPMLQKGMEAQQQARDISGRDFMDSIKVTPQTQGGREWLDVTWLDPAGPASSYYGLLVNDKIIAFGDVDVQSVGAEPASGLFINVYRGPFEKQTLTVVRGTQTLKLPLTSAAPLTPSVPAPPPPTSRANSLPPLQKIPLH